MSPSADLQKYAGQVLPKIKKEKSEKSSSRVARSMTNEFERRIEQLNFNKATAEKVRQLIVEAGKEFPCLNCPSKDECENFKWFLKWFRDEE